MPSFDSKTEYLSKLLLVLDLLVVSGIYIAAVETYIAIAGPGTLDRTSHLGLLPVILVFFTLARLTLVREDETSVRPIFLQMLSVVKVVGATLASAVFVLFLLDLEYFSRAVLLGFGLSVLLALILIRQFVLWFYLTRSADLKDRRLHVLIVGSGRRARMLADQLRKASDWGVEIVGFLDPMGESAGRRATDEILGHVDEISSVLQNNVVEDVVVAVPRNLLGNVQSIIDACQEEGVRLRFMADFYDFEAARIRLTQVNGIPLLSFEPVAREEGALLAKRIFDLVVTLAAMPIILPFMAIVAVAIKLDSKGPILFTQDRIGLHKRPFKMFKFRSMVPDAEQRMAEIEHMNEADGPNFKIENDPRITRLGRFIRKTSIDELPQLFNVIVGDMSLVGPRPMSKRDVNLFDRGLQRKRFSVRPGITCLWQISGRSDLSFDDWLKLDIKYIDNWSFWLDLKILIMTIPTVLKGSGAV